MRKTSKTNAKSQPSKASVKPKPAVRSKDGFRHRLNESYFCLTDEMDKLVRFTVVEQIIRAGDPQEGSKDAVEIIKTAKGGIVVFDATNPRDPHHVFESIEDARGYLSLREPSHREVFTALGGSLEESVPEV